MREFGHGVFVKKQSTRGTQAENGSLNRKASIQVNVNSLTDMQVPSDLKTFEKFCYIPFMH